MKHALASLLMLWALMAPLLGHGLASRDTNGVAGCGHRLPRPSCCARSAPAACPAACCRQAPDQAQDPATPPARPPSTSLSDLTALPLPAVLWSLAEGSRTTPGLRPAPGLLPHSGNAVPLFRRDCALLI